MAASATIKAIEPSTVHQIQSGQVIVDLCSVAKELVENSLDAGATNIEVRFKNQGLDLIEVQDNGSGISPQNYQSLALKHYTSKLSTYADLTSLQTFGFRGEALSSLCALSNFTVITCLQGDVPKGTKLEFETSGKLTSTSIVASQKGTTVIVEKIFKNLPVRRRELERNIKREWGKVVNLLNQYACVQTGVKFSVSQQPTKGKRIVLFSTRGNASTRENIINVFGAKTMSALIKLDLKLELQPTATGAQKWSGQSNEPHQVLIVGHVSRPAHGEGRQTPDRQMFYVNSRPCHLPQFAKVFNEVYKSYNVSQSPFIFADIQLDTHLYDVNVSPDKRTILLHDQGRMLDNLRESLIELFEMQDVTVPISQHPAQKMTSFIAPTLSKGNTLGSDGGTKASVDGGSPTLTGVDSFHIDGSDRLPTTQDASDDSMSHGNRASRAKQTPPIKSHGSNMLANWVERRSSPVGETTLARQNSSDDSGEEEPTEATSNSIRRFRRDENTATGMQAVRVESVQGFEDDSPSALRSTGGQASSSRQFDNVSSSHTRGEPRDDYDVTGGDGSLMMHQEAELEEQPIPAVSTPSRSQATVVHQISPSRRFKRPPSVATITIGDETVTSVIGSTFKRAKLDSNALQASSHQAASRKKPNAKVPSFGGRLTQMFSANSGAASPDASDSATDPDQMSEDLQPAEEEEEEEEEEAEEEESEDDELFVPQSEEVEEVSRSPSEEVDAAGRALSEEISRDASVGSDALSDDACAEGAGDDEYIDEEEKKAQEEQKVQEMIKAAEETAQAPTDQSEKRGQVFIKGNTRRKDSTVYMLQRLKTDEDDLRRQLEKWQSAIDSLAERTPSSIARGGLDAADPEEKLSLAISKTDFDRMRIIGQFNLGFILAVREAAKPMDDDTSMPRAQDDELFIIDQHASDEKYNFERLQAHTVVQSQRLVQPKTLELTAIEEEIILEHKAALEANGFIVSVDESGDKPVGSRCQLLALPLSRETTFSLVDLEELISLLAEHTSATTVPRPARVRKMFAMRACRSSIMIGKALSQKQMTKVVRHMGGMEKPWNCPHGRPTMRHLCGLSTWNERGWVEGDDFEEAGSPVDWTGYVRGNGM